MNAARALALASAALLGACGPGAGYLPSDAATDAPLDAAPEDAGRDAPRDRVAPMACNDLEPSGDVITATTMPGDRPAPTGGALTPGDYALTAITVYTGADAGTAPPFSIREAVRISADTLQSAREQNGAVTRFTLRVSTAGSQITTTQACPSMSAPGTTGYDATATSFTLHLRSPTNITFTYTRR